MSPEVSRDGSTASINKRKRGSEFYSGHKFGFGEAKAQDAEYFRSIAIELQTIQGIVARRQAEEGLSAQDLIDLEEASKRASSVVTKFASVARKHLEP